MPITHATQPSADNPSATTNTTMAPDPNMGGDLAAAIPDIGHPNACPQATQSCKVHNSIAVHAAVVALFILILCTTEAL